MAHEPLSAGSPRSTGSRTPSVPFGFLPRERASARFAEALSRYPVVLLVAPNGYGKTAFLAHELASFPDPVAWLTIDDRVLMPTTFFRALKRSLEQAVPTLETATGGRSESSLDAGRPDIDAYLRLVDRIAETAPRICIVMDGYERIESDDIDSGIDALMAYLPAGAHLVIVSSTRPHLSINRMELSGRLLEMKTADLAFDAEEAAALYNDTLDLSLPLEAVERINDRMDGWVAGLRMAEVALQSGTSVESVLAAGSESQRGISAYLIDDIVDRQSDDVRTFLFESSMFDAFCAELCDCAFERTDSRTMIEQILGNDLFLQPAGQRGWYRYANFFRRCLQDLAADALDGHRQAAHKRASAWFSAHGRYEEALEQALDADDYDQVVALMNNDYAAMMGQDASVRMRDLIHRLPEDIVKRSLWVNIGAAVACEMQQCFTQEDTYVRAALAHASDGQAPNVADAERDSTLVASLQIMQMLEAYHKGDAGQAIEIGQNWLDKDTPDQRGRCGILNVMGMAWWYVGQFDSARSCWQDSATLATYIDWPYSICLNLFGVARAHYMGGDLDSASETCQHIFAISDCRDEPVLSSGYAHMLMAKVHYDRNEFDNARSEISTARRIAESGNERSLAMHAEMALARIEAVSGKDRAATERANRCLSAFCANPQYRQSFDDAHMLMAQIWLLVSKPGLAGDFMRHFADFDISRHDEEQYVAGIMAHDVFGNDFRNVWGEAPLFDYLYYLIQTGRTRDVMPWIDHVQKEAGARGSGFLVAQALVLKALCAYADKDNDAALGWLAEALVLAERNRDMHLFLDASESMEQLLLMAKRKKFASRFMDRLIAEFAALRAVPETVVADYGQTFTRREREVMQLLCGGATNEEITKRLFLSLSTVKNHIHNIYTKLGVRNRAEAIVRLQELGFGKVQHEGRGNC